MYVSLKVDFVCRTILIEGGKMSHDTKCPACTSNTYIAKQHDFYFYECPICGRFELRTPVDFLTLNRNHLAAYLVYHCYKNDKNKIKSEYRYHTMRDKEWCDTYRQKFESGNNIEGYPVHMDESLVENWYPKNFSERVDNILLYIARHTNHIGQWLHLPAKLLLNVLFVDCQMLDENDFSKTRNQWIQRTSDEFIQEANYMLRFLKTKGYIETDEFKELKTHSIVLTPEGYARVDELQKYSTSGRNVLVAMSFKDTQKLREAIRKGVTDAGYYAIFIDEVQHNDFITPELLKYIKDSKFVVADLTHQNNGAYFEEGYAMGLGKPVIQLCQKGLQLHFDIAQKNTIMWDTEDDIPQKLCNRIKATIE